MTRRIWVTSANASTFWSCKIVPVPEGQRTFGLQMQEVWLFWDTALLKSVAPPDAVIFRRDNPFEESKHASEDYEKK